MSTIDDHYRAMEAALAGGSVRADVPLNPNMALTADQSRELDVLITETETYFQTVEAIRSDALTVATTISGSSAEEFTTDWLPFLASLDGQDGEVISAALLRHSNRTESLFESVYRQGMVQRIGHSLFQTLGLEPLEEPTVEEPIDTSNPWDFVEIEDVPEEPVDEELPSYEKSVEILTVYGKPWLSKISALILKGLPGLVKTEEEVRREAKRLKDEEMIPLRQLHLEMLNSEEFEGLPKDFKPIWRIYQALISPKVTRLQVEQYYFRIKHAGVPPIIVPKVRDHISNFIQQKGKEPSDV